MQKEYTPYLSVAARGMCTTVLVNEGAAALTVITSNRSLNPASDPIHLCTPLYPSQSCSTKP